MELLSQPHISVALLRINIPPYHLATGLACSYPGFSWLNFVAKRTLLPAANVKPILITAGSQHTDFIHLGSERNFQILELYYHFLS
jgi:hypothetical protein